jgi:hypothetical protein
MKEKAGSLFGFLNAKDKVFRTVVLIFPLSTAAFSLVLNLLIRGKDLKESLYEAAFLSLAVFAFGLVEEAFRYRRAR